MSVLIHCQERIALLKGEQKQSDIISIFHNTTV